MGLCKAFTEQKFRNNKICTTGRIKNRFSFQTLLLDLEAVESDLCVSLGQGGLCGSRQQQRQRPGPRSTLHIRQWGKAEEHWDVCAWVSVLLCHWTLLVSFPEQIPSSPRLYQLVGQLWDVYWCVGDCYCRGTSREPPLHWCHREDRRHEGTAALWPS